MVSGLELVAGFLVAWAARKARRAGQQADQLVDASIDAYFERLRALVTDKLKDDPALKQLEQQASDGDEVSPRTRQRVTLAIEEAAEDDSQFDTEIENIIQCIQEVEKSGGLAQTSITNAGSITRGNIIGTISGGSVTIDQSERSRETCFCGWEVRATCRNCGTSVCQNHFIEAGAIPAYAVIESVTNEPQYRWCRDSALYRIFMKQGTAACIFCRVNSADTPMTERLGNLMTWLKTPATLTFDQFEQFADLVDILRTEDSATILKHAFHLFDANQKIVHLEPGGRLSKGDPVIILGRDKYVPNYFASKTGQAYMKEAAFGSTSIVVSSWETPSIKRVASGGFAFAPTSEFSQILVEVCLDYGPIFWYLRMMATRV